MSGKLTMPANDCSEYSVNGGSRHQDRQDVQQMQKKLSEVKITSASEPFERHLQKNGQGSKNECLYCDSCDIRQVGNRFLCNECFTYQEQPFAVILPILTVSTRKETGSGPDGFYEKEVQEGTCKYCFRKVLLTHSRDQVCSFCCKPETIKKFFSVNQIQL